MAWYDKFVQATLDGRHRAQADPEGMSRRRGYHPRGSTSSRIPRAATTARPFATCRQPADARRNDRDLLPAAAGEESAWHRVDAAEIWHFYAGDAGAQPVAGRRRTEDVLLGADVVAGERPQAVVDAGCWQSAKSRGGWTLVGCTVGPAFDFAGFEMAPRGWTPA